MYRSSDKQYIGVLLKLSILICASLIFLIIGFLLLQSWPAFREVGMSAFFTDPSWHPLEGLYELTPMISGSLYATLGAVLISVPLGLGIAIYLEFYATELNAALLRRLVEIMSGIPSVVYGLWGMVFIVPMITNIQGPGTSLLAGVLVLSLMILPLFALSAADTLKEIKLRYYKSAYAMGFSESGFIWRVSIPAGKHRLTNGFILSLARAIGETMAVLMVCGNVVQNPASVYDPVRTLTANIALEMAYAMDVHQSALFVSGLLLSCFVFILIMIVRSRPEAKEGLVQQI